MITHIKNDTIKCLPNGKYRAHRSAAWWIGDYARYTDAVRALEIANHPMASDRQRGIYDGGINATEQQHVDACSTPYSAMFGDIENCITDDDIRRTILPGEPVKMVNGWPCKS
jgi:hypothetical protein